VILDIRMLENFAGERAVAQDLTIGATEEMVESGEETREEIAS
jgi:hypothetical protein